MAGILARLGGYRDTADILHLPSRVSIPVDVRRAISRELAVEAGRVHVQTARIQGVGHVGAAAMRVIGSTTRLAEDTAMICPVERVRIDSVADVVAVTCSELVAEMGRR